MIIGVPRETKTHEYRVAMTPAAVAEACNRGHQVLVQTQAGIGAGFSDDDYVAAGASLLSDVGELFASAALIVKVKEPQPDEYGLLRRGQTLFTYLHLAADMGLTQALCDSGATCIAYETISDSAGGLPLLAPMSQIAGRLAAQAGATHLEKHLGGAGLLLGGATGVPPATVTVIGGGVVGSNAIQIAMGMGARVCVLDKSVPQLTRLSERFGPALTTCYATTESTTAQLIQSDLVIGAVLVAGRSAARVISADMVRQMRSGSVIVDVAIDQGGCCETSRPTTHQDPTFVAHDVVHYCVANMPGAVPATASRALSHATLPFVLALAEKGVKAALAADPHLQRGLNIDQGQITHAGVAESLSAAQR